MKFSVKRLSVNINGMNTKNYDRKDDSFDLYVDIEVKDKKEIISKRFIYNEKTEDVVLNMIEVIKNKVTKDNYIDDHLSHLVIIIENFEDREEKMIGFVKKINDKIKNFKLYKSGMSSFEMVNSMNELSVKF